MTSRWQHDVWTQFFAILAYVPSGQKKAVGHGKIFGSSSLQDIRYSEIQTRGEGDRGRYVRPDCQGTNVHFYLIISVLDKNLS